MENVKAIVSQNLLRLRKENNLTQAELARRINYSDKAISRWEAGEVVPDLETIYALSEVFDVPVSQITEARSKGADGNRGKELGQKILSQIFLCCEIWLIFSTIFVWSFTTCIYLHLIESNPWYMFFIGLPAQGLLIIRYLFNYKQNLKGIRLSRRTKKRQRGA